MVAGRGAGALRPQHSERREKTSSRGRTTGYRMLLSTLVMPQVTNTGCGFSSGSVDKLADGGKVADVGWQQISKTLSKKEMPAVV